ncbi:MAG TPA: aminoacyl-tRNA hydrolase [Puia sp.]|jgi:PTH1 family peptidyl-tRNA hydrolase|nr:aminoacyl-tRNA hydrolase [Puia sp.]
MNKFLIAGLGNVGTEYGGTRHNIGFDIANVFVHKHGGSFKNERYAGVSKIKVKGKPVTCIVPTTYMNLSGNAVKYWLDKEGIAISNLLVVVDDIALPLNKLRLRPSGSDAGHNGLKSVQEVLGTIDYPRLRFGVGNNYPKGMQVDFVLGKWFDSEIPLVKLKIEKSVELLESFINIGIEQTMNLYNKLEITL